jgi:hypothetical protein
MARFRDCIDPKRHVSRCACLFVAAIMVQCASASFTQLLISKPPPAILISNVSVPLELSLCDAGGNVDQRVTETRLVSVFLIGQSPLPQQIASAQISFSAGISQISIAVQPALNGLQLLVRSGALEALSSAFAVQFGAVSSLSIASAPDIATVLLATSDGVVLHLLDAGGNVVESANASLSFSKLSGFGTVSLATQSPPLQILRGQGRLGPLVFSVVDTYVVQFVAHTATAAFSARITVTVTAFFSQLDVSGIPLTLSVVSGTALPPFIVRALDAFDNLCALSSGVVQLAATPGAIIHPSQSSAQLIRGVGAFSNTTVYSSGSTITLSASFQSVSKIISVVTVTPAPAVAIDYIFIPDIVSGSLASATVSVRDVSRTVLFSPASMPISAYVTCFSLSGSAVLKDVPVPPAASSPSGRQAATATFSLNVTKASPACVFSVIAGPSSAIALPILSETSLEAKAACERCCHIPALPRFQAASSSPWYTAVHLSATSASTILEHTLYQFRTIPSKMRRNSAV